jgi:hypothetical protein
MIIHLTRKTMKLFTTIFETEKTESTKKKTLTIDHMLQIKGGGDGDGGIILK